MIKLCKCPFCGASGMISVRNMNPWEASNITPVEGGDGKWYYVECSACTCTGPEEITREGAIELWNTRANID